MTQVPAEKPEKVTRMSQWIYWKKQHGSALSQREQQILNKEKLIS